jgi:chromosome segregation ATPase
MFGLMTKAAHEAAMAAKDAEIAELWRKIEVERATIDALDKSARKFRQERDDALAELHPLKAQRERANANLAAANAARRAKAAERTVN